MVVIICKSIFKYICKYFIKIGRYFCEILLSLPLRKCGLKLTTGAKMMRTTGSLPLRKCGLKYNKGEVHRMVKTVTSLAEVWIEIDDWGEDDEDDWSSLPLRKCGLKSGVSCCISTLFGHFPCGSVD